MEARATSRDDGRLIAAFLAGDEAAVRRVQGWLEEGSRSFRCRLDWQWEDISQDLILEVTRLLRAGTFAGRSSLRTYVWRIAANACLNRLRQTRIERRVEIDEMAESLEAPGPSVLDELMAAESADRLARLAARMSAQCRQMWFMLLEGQSYAEMSRRLKIAVGTLRVRVYRCRRRAVELWRQETETAWAATGSQHSSSSQPASGA